MDPFRQAITISSICNKVFRKMFLKPDTVCIIPREGTEWKTASLLKLFNGGCKLVGRWTVLLMQEMERTLIYLGYQMWKATGTVQGTMNSLSTLRVFGMGVDVCPIDINPSATLEKLLFRYEETQGSLQKIRGAGYKSIWMWGCEFRKLLRDNPDLKNELSLQFYVKNSPINIRDALYKATNTYYRVQQGNKSILWVLSVCTPTSVSTASFLRSPEGVRVYRISPWLFE